MIQSSLHDDDEERLKSAYANLSLVADTIWAFDEKEDISYRKLNQSLWLKVREFQGIK